MSAPGSAWSSGEITRNSDSRVMIVSMAAMTAEFSGTTHGIGMDITVYWDCSAYIRQTDLSTHPPTFSCCG